MTAFELQDSLVEEIKLLLKDFRHPARNKKNNDIEEFTKYNVFAQELPLIVEDSKEHFPYVIVRILEGRIPGEEPVQEVSTLLIVGAYDKSLNKQGHRIVLNVINKIIERFRKDPMLDHKFMAKPEMEWAIQDEDIYPQYIGAIQVKWITRTFKKEDSYS